MSQACVLSKSLYNAKDCDDCGKCGREGKDVFMRHTFKYDLNAPVSPAVKEHLERIRAKKDK